MFDIKEIDVSDGSGWNIPQHLWEMVIGNVPLLKKKKKEFKCNSIYFGQLVHSQVYSIIKSYK